MPLFGVSHSRPRRNGHGGYYAHPGPRLSAKELQPQRLDGESFEAYRERRARANRISRHKA